MSNKILYICFPLGLAFVLTLACVKNRPNEEHVCSIHYTDPTGPCYNLDVILNGNGKDKKFGFIKFRQDPDTDRVITLETSVANLLPNHEYFLQRAVDPVVDGNCTSTAWLTLGKGLAPQSILTDAHGNGEEELWRNVSAAARGTAFDIHFQIIDATSLETVLASDCYQYTVR